MLVLDRFLVSYADKKWAEDPWRPFPRGGRCEGKPDQIHQIQNEGPLAMSHDPAQGRWYSAALFHYYRAVPCGDPADGCCRTG